MARRRNTNGAKPNGNGNGNGRRKATQNAAAGMRPQRPRGRRNRNQNGNQMATMPMMMGMNNIRPLRQAVTTLSGSDFYGTVRVKATPTTTERILLTIPVSPSAFAGTRITQLSQLWERYRFTSFRFRYVPAVPTTLACQFVLYVDTDPSDDPTSAATADILIRQATAQTGSQQWNFNVPKSTPLAIRCDDQFYYTGDTKLNERFSLQGKAYVIQVTDPINFNGEVITGDFTCGSVYIDWVCQFQIPQINPAGYEQRDATVEVSALSNSTATTTPSFFTYLNPRFVVGSTWLLYVAPVTPTDDSTVVTTDDAQLLWYATTDLRDDGSAVIPSERTTIIRSASTGGDSYITTRQGLITVKEDGKLSVTRRTTVGTWTFATSLANSLFARRIS